jgi:hypothetical protein
VLPVGFTVVDATNVIALMAASIAVCGFLGQVWPALTRQGDQEVRAATGVGGLVGFAIAMAIIGADLTW